MNHKHLQGANAVYSARDELGWRSDPTSPARRSTSACATQTPTRWAWCTTRNYLVWCEVGRTDFIRTLGMSYAEIERRGFGLAVADLRARFLAPARYDELIRRDERP